MSDGLDFRPGVGLGAIRFGMTLDEVVAVVGPPERRWYGERYDPEEEDQTVGPRLRVDAWRCEFWFKRDERLHWIVCMNPEMRFEGAPLIGRPLDAVVELLATSLGELPETPDDYECENAWDRRFFPEHWIDVQAHFGTVDAVDFGHLYTDDDQPIWPS